MRISGYIPVAVLHEGDNSVVHRAVRERDGRSVVLKHSPREYPLPRELLRFQREYDILQRFSTPAVVAALDLVHWEHRPVLVLEDRQAISLRQLLESPQGQDMGLEGRLQLCLHLARAMAEVHGANVTHRDVIPDNILYAPQSGDFFFIDFGIASLEAGESGDADEVGDEALQSAGALGLFNSHLDMLEGHLSHIAPEQLGLDADSRGDWRVDLYALGVTFHEVLTGKLPYEADSPLAMVHQHLAAPLPQLEGLALPQLAQVVRKLLAKAPEERYQSAAGVAADLERLLAAGGGPAQTARFELASHDRPQRFSVPGMLYGRAGELETLSSALKDLEQAPPRLLLVKGAPGIGKTALVRQLVPLATRQGALFIQGKYDQLQRNAPFTGLGQAFQELARQVLGFPEAAMRAWQERILEAVGPNGRILLDLAPDMELVIGPQPQLPPLGQAESLSRFHMVLSSFLRVCSRELRPLVIFLDDLQWADAPSLMLLELMTGASEEGRLLILGAYRDSEVPAGHPLSQVLISLGEAGAGPEEVLLGPLSAESVGRLVTDTLCGVGASDSLREQALGVGLQLADLLLHKTGGNPFFLRQYLEYLHAQGAIHRLPGAAFWTCDLERAEALEVSDNVAQLMARRMGLLPPATRHMLRIAGCLGGSFGLQVLARAGSVSEDKARLALLPALRTGLLQLETRALALHDISATLHLEVGHFRFLHDKVQQAAYDLVPDERKAPLHLRIGRILREELANSSQEERKKLLFDVTDHLNRGAALMDSREELLELAQLNAESGRQARDSAAYEVSLASFQAAMDALPDDVWTTERDLAFTMHTELARALSWAGRHEQAQAAVERGMQLAHSPLEQVGLLRIMVIQHTLLSELPQALQHGVDALRLLGLDVPHDGESMARHIKSILPEVHERLQSTPLEQLLDLPELAVPEYREMITVVADLAGPASIADQQLWTLLVLETLRIVTVHGHTSESLGAYICYLHLIILENQDYPFAARLIDLSTRLMQKFPNRYCDSMYTAMLAFHVAQWTMPMAESLAMARTAGKMCQENGAFVYSGFASIICCSRIFLTANDLEQAIRGLDAEIRHQQSYRYVLALDMAQGLRIIAANLAGLTASAEAFSCDQYDERRLFSESMRSHNMVSFVSYCIFKALAQAIYGRNEEVLPLLEEAENVGKIYVGSCFNTLHVVLDALILAGAQPDELDPRRSKRRKDSLRHLQILAEVQPNNFLGNACLARAVAARTEGRPLEAADLYEQAIAANRQAGFLHFQALACEKAGLFWKARGNEIASKAYLREARYLYGLWGARRKAQLMDDEHGLLLEKVQAQDASARNWADSNLSRASAATSVLDRRVVELAAIMKSARSISEEIELDLLLPRLLTTMCEHAGAGRGVYYESQGDFFVPRAVFAASEAPPQGGSRFASRLLEADEALETQEQVLHMLQMAARRGEAVVTRLEESIWAAQGPGARAGGKTRQHPLARLCMPLLRKDRLVGALYCENDLNPRAFGSEILPALEALASQAAVSLENAALYAELREAENQYREIFESSVAGIFQTTPQGRILVVNQAAATILGYDSPEHLLRCVRNLKRDFYLHAADRDLFMQQLEAGNVVNFEIQARSAAGNVLWLSINAAADRDEQGRILRIQGFFEDITRRKQDQERIRKLSRELLRIQEQERARISRELHDNLAQDLLSIKLYMHLMQAQPERYGAQSLQPGQREGLQEQLKGLLEQSIATVRELSYSLRPPELAERGLTGALEGLCREKCVGAGLQLAWDICSLENLPLSEDDQVNIFRLVQEALQNTIKHAGASMFRLELARTATGLRLRMGDDGRGFDVAARQREAALQKHLGLVGMHERARLMGGELLLESAPGEGVQATLEIPLEAGP